MSSSKTEHYQLHRWEPRDEVLRTEFNENFQLLDTAARIVVGTYVGDGAESRHIELGFQPQAVLVMSWKGVAGQASATGYGGLAVGNARVEQTATIPVLEIEATGFKVYQSKSSSTDSAASNRNSYSYRYLAVR